MDKKKTCLITGGAGGLGKNYAKRFLREGCNVVFSDLNDSLANETLEELKQYGDVQYVHSDVTVQADREALIEKTLEYYGSLEVLVNNAGVAGRSYLEDIDEALWDRVVDINMKAVFFMSQLAAEVMKKQHYGKIINITSPRSIMGDTRHLMYGATKKAVDSMTQYLGISLARYGINVNAVSIGMVITPMSEHHLKEDPDFVEKVARIHPINRILEMDDIANVVLFLASDQASCLVGQVLFTDGGFTAINQAEAPTMTWRDEL